jgi:hypothetical protein
MSFGIASRMPNMKYSRGFITSGDDKEHEDGVLGD